MLAMHTLLSQCRPQVLVELGSCNGGSAAFFTSFAKEAGIEEIISLDLNDVEKPDLEGVTWIQGDDTSPEIFEKVKEMVGDRSVALNIDANHHYDFVKKELNTYGTLVTPGQCLILEDTHVDILNYKVFRPNGGPLAAMKEWLPSHPDFELAKDIEPYITTNYFGYWVRRS